VCYILTYRFSFLFKPYLPLHVFVRSFALKWLPFFVLLGTDATDAVPVPSTGTAKEVGPLTSFTSS
jgi:hypothetical protein